MTDSKTGKLTTLLPPEELAGRVLGRSIATIAWVSFVFAGIASTVFFATFHPIELALSATFPWQLSALAGYSIGFIGFWLLCFACSTSSFLLLALPVSKRSRDLPD